jgi:hypothetical protein
VGLNVVIIEEDELFNISRMVYDIKKHLKLKFDLDGHDQPWHMFDDVEFELMILVNKE